ncbi:hypothetical protein VTO73DRAFT_15472 [Trametes versicolor]
MLFLHAGPANFSARRSPTVTKWNKTSISFPRAYDWPKFAPSTPVPQPALPRVEIDYAPAFGYQSLGCKLLSLEDAQGHVEIVQRSQFRYRWITGPQPQFRRALKTSEDQDDGRLPWPRPGNTVRLTAAAGHLRDRGVMTLLNSLSSPMLDARSVSELDPPFMFVAAIPFPTDVSFRNPRTTRTTTDPTDTEDRGPRTEEHAG